jgi:hypothetical protein
MEQIKEGMKWAFYLWVPTALMFCLEMFLFEGNSVVSPVTGAVVLVLMTVAWPFLAIFMWLNIDSYLPDFAAGLLAIYLGWMILGILSACLLASLQRMRRPNKTTQTTSEPSRQI